MHLDSIIATAQESTTRSTVGSHAAPYSSTSCSSHNSDMLQPRIRAARPTLEHLTNSLSALCLRQPNQTRHASHAAQGRANGPTDSAGRRLGLKKGNSEHVVPGNIIFKQRGTKWHPGENVGVGKDHTLYALAEGFVRYYRNPAVHPTRRFIGVALAKDGKESMLPTPANAPTRRRVGMVAVPMKAPATQSEADQFLEQHATPGSKPASPSGMQPPTPVKPADAPIMRFRGYRISNVQLARDAEANAVKVRPYVRKDRWYAWRVRVNKAKNRKVFRASGGGGRKKSAGPRGGTKKTKAKR